MYEVDYYQDTEVAVKFQPIDLCRELPFSLGCAVKYILRAGHKTDDVKSDLVKAVDYLNNYLTTAMLPPDLDTSEGGLFEFRLKLSPRATVALNEYCKRNPFLKTLFDDFDYDLDEDAIKAAISEIRMSINKDN